MSKVKMLPSLRITGLPLVRASRCKAVLNKRNLSMAPTVALRTDLVQDLYLRELRNYKPTPTKLSDASSHVQTFSIPKPPPSPEDIEVANDLKAYEDQLVEIEGLDEEGEEDPDYKREFFEKPIRDIDEIEKDEF